MLVIGWNYHIRRRFCTLYVNRGRIRIQIFAFRNAFSRGAPLISLFLLWPPTLLKQPYSHVLPACICGRLGPEPEPESAQSLDKIKNNTPKPKKPETAECISTVVGISESSAAVCWGLRRIVYLGPPPALGQLAQPFS